MVILTLLLNALFHHSLLYIPQQEIPGEMPSAYIMRHPKINTIETWWSPCPSRECPEEDNIYIVIEQCVDHCLLRHPEIEIDAITARKFGTTTTVPTAGDSKIKILPSFISNSSNESVYYEGNFTL